MKNSNNQVTFSSTLLVDNQLPERTVAIGQLDLPMGGKSTILSLTTRWLDKKAEATDIDENKIKSYTTHYKSKLSNDEIDGLYLDYKDKSGNKIKFKLEGSDKPEFENFVSLVDEGKLVPTK